MARSSAAFAAVDMICGGVGEVLIEYVDAIDRNNRIVCEAAIDVLERGASRRRASTRTSSTEGRRAARTI